MTITNLSTEAIWALEEDLLADASQHAVNYGLDDDTMFDFASRLLNVLSTETLVSLVA